MKRLLILAALAVALQAGPASAQFIKISGVPGNGCGSGNQPPPLGPWYNYWPLEAHFQVPAMPEYPYFSAPQTLPIGRPGGAYGGHGQMPHYGGAPAMAGGGYPGMNPYAAPGAYAAANPYAGVNPYAAMNPYAARVPQAPAQPGYPAANTQQQQQQTAPAPTQQGAMYYPNPYAGYYPAQGYYPGAARR
jgi:hypothetical protein